MQTGEFLEFSDRKEPRRDTARRITLFTAPTCWTLRERPRSQHRSISAIASSDLEEQGDRHHAHFRQRRRVEAEIVIGADGVRSVVRQALYGDDNPTYTGQMVWRALLNGSEVPPEVLEPDGHIQWVGPGCHFIALLHSRPRSS